MDFGCSPLVLHILLNQMAALVFNNFILVFLKLLYTFACWALIIFIFVTVQYYQFYLKIGNIAR